MKTHFKKLRNPNYLGSWDLTDDNGKVTPRTFTISGVKKEMLHDGKGGQEECVVVMFKESKPMVANSTNLKAIAKVVGSPYVEDWIGQQITLTVRKVSAFGEVHDAIRVDTKPPVKQKPQLVPGSPVWEKAVEYLRGGGEVNLITSKYDIDLDTLKKLKDETEHKS
jgi:hypothetical protein